MRKIKTPSCKDCGTENVIMRYNRQDGMPKIDEFTVVLCASCLHMRAQLAIAKERKLTFPKLMAKIQKETFDRVHRETVQSSVLDMLNMARYKGKNSYTTLATYWQDQLAKDTSHA